MRAILSMSQDLFARMSAHVHLLQDTANFSPEQLSWGDGFVTGATCEAKFSEAALSEFTDKIRLDTSHHLHMIRIHCC